MALPDAVKLGVSPLSWTNDVLEDLGGAIALETCLDQAAAAGFGGIELGRKFPRDVDSLRPLLDRHALSLVSGWYSGALASGDVATEIAAVAPHAQLLHDMGCEVMVYGEVAMMTGDTPLDVAMSTRTRMPEAARAAYGARLTAFAAHLQAHYGLRLAYHHHLMMVAETLDEIDAILSACGPEVGLLLDTGHAVGAGFDYGALIERFGARIAHIHLKDIRPEVMAKVRTRDLGFNQGVRAGMFTVPGDGCIDFAPLARFVIDSGYRGWLVIEAEQDPAKAEPQAAVRQGKSHILSVFDGF
ncbi:Inosose dehydratase [Aquimixticola soesokkakensis]|uniref:Inosose dehydratase n=1 Tax=Aquimixticola soesokkakensis TaxID=1519096 RepID=A0A1Y5TF00_9RHOB|nr:myo-inosose-2 dehydratase [Aquimixticola soesokkakensis]SLN62555.1 Inosose dehydratase [Aquimixticola soesokkakensis]